MRVGAIIQARVGSTRLPGKVLLQVNGKTILEYVLERVKRARCVDDVIVATSTEEEDSRIYDLVSSAWKAYRGSEEDVLDRYYQTAKYFSIEHIVRVTSDCPLLDPEIIDKVVDRYFEAKADYCSNTLKETFPDGQDVEVFSFEVLSDAWKNANLSSEREHVTPYIKGHPDMFKLVNFCNDEDLSDKRWTLDENKDFDFIKAIIEGRLKNKPDFNMQDVLDFLKENPHLEKINKGLKRNEGYLRSLKEDRQI